MMKSQKLEFLSKKLILISGKGGVGKTTVAKTVASTLSRKARPTLFVVIEDPQMDAGVIEKIDPYLDVLNTEPASAFEHFVSEHIPGGKVARLFLKNRLVAYLSKAAPGISSLVILGKIIHETRNYDHVVVDMPSTGFGLAMFHATLNFSKLFKGGLIHNETKRMLDFCREPKNTAHVIVSLPEEMPLVESLELDKEWMKLFPENPSHFILNKRFPHTEIPKEKVDWQSPLSASKIDHVRKKIVNEEKNMNIWNQKSKDFFEIPIIPKRDSDKIFHINTPLVTDMRDMMSEVGSTHE